jgi:hypothetical protein
VSTLALSRPGARRRDPAPSAPSLFDQLGGGPTLDELLAGVWEGLAAQRPVACPVCGGEMAAEYGAHSRPVGGRCLSCASVLR